MSCWPLVFLRILHKRKVSSCLCHPWLVRPLCSSYRRGANLSLSHQKVRVCAVNRTSRSNMRVEFPLNNLQSNPLSSSNSNTIISQLVDSRNNLHTSEIGWTYSNPDYIRLASLHTDYYLPRGTGGFRGCQAIIVEFLRSNWLRVDPRFELSGVRNRNEDKQVPCLLVRSTSTTHEIVSDGCLRLFDVWLLGYWANHDDYLVKEFLRNTTSHIKGWHFYMHLIF